MMQAMAFNSSTACVLAPEPPSSASPSLPSLLLPFKDSGFPGARVPVAGLRTHRLRSPLTLVSKARRRHEVKAVVAPDPIVELPLTAENVELVLDEVRPYLISDGGNVALHEIDGNVVRLKLQGACGSCPSSVTTMKLGIERRLMEKIPEIVAVEPITDEETGLELNEENIEKVLDEIRPYLVGTGGGELEFVSIEKPWKEKDCAIYLVVALSNKTGGSIIDVQSFFTSVIVPELQGQEVNSTPVLKAGALKFFTVFREQIPKQIAVTLLPDVVRFLAAESNVVHSYAANCIEKLLLVKDSAPGLNAAVSSHPRYGASDINPYLPSLLSNLFNALKLSESQENPYVMKCIMRVLGIADVDPEVTKFCIGSLALLLDEARKNPRNPLFNHYLFEAIAALTGRSCERERSLIGVFETNLFPVLQSILVEDVADFWPYTFQIFAQLVDVSSPPLSEHYMQLFEVLLSEATWKRPGNAPALVRLLQAYLQKVPSELNNQGNLIKVLDRFGSLVSKSHTEDLGFYVLNTVAENLNYDIIAPFIGRIWAALFERLKVQQNRSVKYVNSVVIFMSLVLVKHGIGILVDSINTLDPNNPNLFGNILQQFWIPNVRLISGPIELKLVAVASTRLLCESMVLLDPLVAELWGRMLDSITSLLSRPDNGGVEIEADAPDIPDNMGYSASFARLHHAGKKQEDPLKNVSSPKEFLITSLARLSAATRGRYPAIIENFVDPANRAFLLQLCGAYNCTIV